MLPANCSAEWRTKWHRGHENWKCLKVGHVKQILNTYSTNAKSCLRSKGKASNYTQYPAKLYIPSHPNNRYHSHFQRWHHFPSENSTISAPSHMDSRRTGSTIGTAVSGLGQREDLEEMLSWAARWLPADFRRQWCGWDQISWNFVYSCAHSIGRKHRIYKESKGKLSIMRTIQLDQSLFDLSGIFLAAGKGAVLGISGASRLPKCCRNDWYEWETNWILQSQKCSSMSGVTHSSK